METIFLYIALGALFLTFYLISKERKDCQERIKKLENDPIVVQRGGTFYRKSQIMQDGPEKQWPALKKELGI